MDKNYLVFTRKWRPKTFEEITGQGQVVLPLKRAIELNRIMHAYLFSGPRGVGKTTTARVLAKSLNCEKGPTISPCNTCSMCREIAEGNSMDVIEIDGASNRGIDEIRDLREQVGFGAARGRYKLYIIDEVHMLTKEAFNALLKTLEEPPAHVIFVLATTDPQKIPQTILSRCQHFRFRRMPSGVIVENLKMIAGKESIDFDEEALYMISKAADGSMRDGQRIFDQAVTYARNEKLTTAVVSEMLGEIEVEVLNRLMEAVVYGNVKNGLSGIEKIFGAGYDLKHFLRDFISMLRNMMVIKTGDEELVENMGKEEAEYIKKLSGDTGAARILYMLKKTIAAEQLLDKTSLPNIVLEVLVMELMPGNETREENGPAPPEFKEKNVPSAPPAVKKQDTKTEPEKKEETHQPAMIIDSIEEEEKISKLTLDIVEKRWENIIDRARAKGKEEALVQALSSAGIASCEEPNLFIVGENPFLTETLRKNIDEIRGIIREEFKKDLKVIIYCKEEYKKRREVKEEVMEEEAKNHPVVKELSKFFDFTDVKIERKK